MSLALGAGVAGLASPKTAKFASLAVALSALAGSFNAWKQISSVDWGWWSWLAMAFGGIWALLWALIGLAMAAGLWFYGSMMAAKRAELEREALEGKRGEGGP